MAFLLPLLALSLSGCELIGLGGEAAGAAAIDGAASAVTASEAMSVDSGAAAAGAETTSSRLFIDSSVSTGAPGELGEAVDALRNRVGRVDLHSGSVWVGGQDVAEIREANLVYQGNVVGNLDGGVLRDSAGRSFGELRGLIPGTAQLLQFADGTSTLTSRSLMVTVERFADGVYTVQLPTGETATYAGEFSVLALIAAWHTSCSDRYGRGFAATMTGDVLPFTQCTDEGSAVALTRGNRTILIDRRVLLGLVLDGQPTTRASVSQPAPAAAPEVQQDDGVGPNAAPPGDPERPDSDGKPLA